MDTATMITAGVSALGSGSVVAAVARYLGEKWLRDREEFERATAKTLASLSADGISCYEKTQTLLNALREERRKEIEVASRTAHNETGELDSRMEGKVDILRDRTLVTQGEMGAVISSTKNNAAQIETLAKKLDAAVEAWGQQSRLIELAVKGLTIVLEERLPRRSGDRAP